MNDGSRPPTTGTQQETRGKRHAERGKKHETRETHSTQHAARLHQTTRPSQAPWWPLPIGLSSKKKKKKKREAKDVPPREPPPPPSAPFRPRPLPPPIT